MAKVNYSDSSNFTDRWFKIKYTSRKQRDGVPVEIDYAFTTGHNKFFVKFDAQQSAGAKYFIEVKPVSYRDMIKEISKRSISKELS